MPSEPHEPALAEAFRELGIKAGQDGKVELYHATRTSADADSILEEEALRADETGTIYLATSPVIAQVMPTSVEALVTVRVPVVELYWYRPPPVEGMVECLIFTKPRALFPVDVVGWQLIEGRA